MKTDGRNERRKMWVLEGRERKNERKKPTEDVSEWW